MKVCEVCGQPAKFGSKIAGVTVAYYCSEEHYKMSALRFQGDDWTEEDAETYRRLHAKKMRLYRDRNRQRKFSPRKYK